MSLTAEEAAARQGAPWRGAGVRRTRGDLLGLIGPPGAGARTQALIDLVVAPRRPTPPSIAPTRILDQHAFALAPLGLPGVRQHKVGLWNARGQRHDQAEKSKRHPTMESFLGRAFKFESLVALFETIDIQLGLYNSISMDRILCPHLEVYLG
jgi:hypothetical protein